MKMRRRSRQFSAVNIASPPGDGHEMHRKKHQKKSKRLKLLLVGLVVAVAAIAGAAGYFYIQNSRQSESAAKALQDVLQVQEASKNLKPVRSKLGFAFKYYEPMIFGTGYVLKGDGKTEQVSGGDLPNSNDSYSVVALEDKDSEAATDVLSKDFSIRGTNLTISTSALKDFFAKRKQEFGNLSDIDLAVKHFEPKPAANKAYKLDGEEEVTLEGKTYKKRSYSITDTQYAPTPDGGEIRYVTVQNNRPYVFTLRYYAFTAPQKMTLFEDVIKSTEYFAPEADAQLLGASDEAVDAPNQAVLAESTDDKLLEETANVPYTLEDSTILEVVAKNQLSVVRVGAIDCKDFDVLLPSGAVGFTAKGACSAGGGTGAIVSTDGYISTNGHVVKQGYAPLLQTYLVLSLKASNPEPFKQYIQYLQDVGLATQPQLVSIGRAIQAGDESAFTKLLALTQLIPTKSFKLGAESGQYAIQLSDEPIKLTQTGTKLSFNYNEEVVEAEFKDMNYDQYIPAVTKRDPKISDVAILKIKEGNYPVALLGSFDDVGKGSLLTSIGFPGFVDGGLVTTKTRTIPSVTQGTIQAIQNDSDGSPLLLAATSVPGAQGNSGGPNFSETGLSVGLTTYGGNPNDPEEGISKFGPGILRNAADFTALLEKNNITLDTNSTITQTWDKAIDSFSKAHYKAALGAFDSVKKEYPNQYLVAEFAETAQAKIDAGEDRTPNNTAVIVVLVVFAGLIVTTVVVIVIIIKHHKKGKQLPPAAPASPQQSQVQVPVPTMPPVAPVAAAGAPQPLAPPPQPVFQPPAAPQPQVAPAPPQPMPQPVVAPQSPPQPPVVAAQPPVPHTVIEPTSDGIELQIPHDQS